MLNTGTTVTLEFEVLPLASVTLTVTAPAAAGAVKAPVPDTTEPPPAAIAKVYGVTPPVAAKVCVPLTAMVRLAGEITRAGLIVTEAVAVLPRASVTKTTAEPLLAGAV